MTSSSYIVILIVFCILIYLVRKRRPKVAGKSKSTETEIDRILQRALYIFPYFFDKEKVGLTYKDERVIVDAAIDKQKNMIAYGYFETTSGKPFAGLQGPYL